MERKTANVHQLFDANGPAYPVDNMHNINNDVSSRYGSGSGSGGGDNMLEARVAKLEADVGYIRRDVDELKVNVKSVDRNIIIVLERLETIKDSLSKKPSADTVDKKITDAKLAVLLGVPAIIAAGTGLYKLIQNYL